MAEIAKIEKLNGKNFQSWKYNVKLVLMERGLWGFTQEGQETPPEETATTTVKNAFRLRKDKAYSLIALNVEKDLQIHISSVTDPLVAWDRLRNQFEFVSVTQIVRITRKFYAASMEEGADLMKHLTTMTCLAEQLRELNEEIPSRRFATVVLGSLPESYDNFLTSLNARNADNLDWENVKGLLIEEFMKRTEKSEREASENAMFAKRDQQRERANQQQNGAHGEAPRGRPYGRGRARGGQYQNNQERLKNIDCYNCHQFGHFSRDCTAPRNSRRYEGSSMAQHEVEEEEVNERGEIALLCSTTTSKGEWFIDSAATKHMTNDETLLNNFVQYTKPTKIYLGDDTIVLALGEGEVDLTTCKTPNTVLKLHKVLFVPKMAKNLLSVPAMALMGAQVRFDKEHCIVQKNGQEYVIGSLHDNKLYIVNTVEYAHVSTAPSDANLTVWHCRFGHLNYDYVNKLAKEEMVQGMKIDGSTLPNKQCEACIMGKMQRKPFPKQSSQRATRPFEVVHSDICGPMQIPSKGGSRYILTFTDDYSRFVITYFIKTKDEMLTKFKEYVSYVERQFGNHIETLVLPEDKEDNPEVKTLRSDNGGEYVSKESTKFCKEKGISQEYTNPYCPEQNGVAERLNRTIMESARSMLNQAKLPMDFWAEACNTAVYNHNRSPTAALENKTPFECVFNRKPNVSHLRVFGCVSYAHVPDSRRKKLDVKARKAIFVGYPTGVKGYKLYDIERKKFIVSRNVIFWENRFDHASEAENMEPSSFYPENEDDEELSVREFPMERNEIHEEPVEQEPVVEIQRRQTYEDSFMEEVQNLPNVRQRKSPQKLRDEECFVANSLTTDIDEPDSVRQALNGEMSQQWKGAMDAEYSSLMENETWDLVPPPKGVNVLGSRWVFKTKRDEEGKVDRHKARLVAQGYSQTKGIDYEEVFSPVARQASVRSLLALANAHNLEVHQMDVKTAFLNGTIDCEIYMTQPEGFVDPDKPDHVCKLRKSIYGLKQSARCWNTTLDQHLQSKGYRTSGADGCVYVKSNKGQNGHVSYVILGVYVDDIIVISNDSEMLMAEKAALCQRFKMVDQGEIHYLLGMLIKRDRDSRTLTISQPGYIEKVLERFNMENCKPVSTPLEPGKKFQQLSENDQAFDTHTYQQAIGCLTYVSTTTRPDISAAVNVLSQYMSKPSKDHWIGVKRALRYLRGTMNFGLKFSVDDMNPQLTGYSDADWAGDQDTRKSTSGYVFKIGNGTVSWSSKKQSTVAKSSTEAEYVALSTATQEAIWLRRLMVDLGKSMDTPTIIYEDNQGAIELAKNPKYHNRTKHIDICYHFVRERIASNEIHVEYCPTEFMTADIMTKGLTRATFEKFRNMLGVYNIVY